MTNSKSVLKRHSVQNSTENVADKMREAFEKLFPEDSALINLAENNSDFRLEASTANRGLSRFKAGWKAATKPQPTSQEVIDAEKGR